MRRRLALMLALMLAFTMLATACDPTGGTTPPTSTTTPPTSGDTGTTPPTTPPPPDEEQIFRYGFNYWWPDTKNAMTYGYSITSTVYLNQLYEPLCDYGLDNKLEGRLAEKWEVSDDGLTWTFYLRKDVKWHDGEAFNADDVVFTYQKTLDLETNRYTQVKEFKINKVDDYTVQLITEQPKSDTLASFIYIVPEHIYGKYADTKDAMLAYDGAECIGTGPFKFVGDKMDEYVEFVANDEYWNGRPGIDRLMFIVYTNDDTMYQALAAGEIDYCGIKANQEEAAKSAPGITALRYKGQTFYELGFNCWQDPESKGNPLIFDKYIKQAIDYAIDYDRIIEYALGGLGTVEKSLVASFCTEWWVDLKAEGVYREFSPEKAKALLDEHGYTVGSDGIRQDKDGRKLDFRFTVIEGDYRDQALIIQQCLKEVGINTTIDFVDSGRQGEIIEQQGFDTDMYIWGWSPGTTDPSYALSVITSEQRFGGRSDCWYSNPEYDALYEKQKLLIDYDERYAVVKDAVKICYEDCPYLILYTNIGLSAHNSDKWDGYKRDLGGEGGVWNYYTRLTLQPK